MNKREQLQLQFDDENLRFSDPIFDEAIISVDFNTFNCPARVVYDVDKCIEILRKEYEQEPRDEDGETPEESATAMVSHNYVGAYHGENTPIWISLDLFD